MPAEAAVGTRAGGPAAARWALMYEPDLRRRLCRRLVGNQTARAAGGFSRTGTRAQDRPRRIFGRMFAFQGAPAPGPVWVG